MPSQQVTYRSAAIVQAAPPAAETVIAQLAVGSVQGTNPVQLNAWAMLTTSAGTTAVVLRIRRNSLTGTLVSSGSSQIIIAAAGSLNLYEDFAVDNPGETAGQLYVLTSAFTGGGAANTVGAVLLTAQTP